MKLIIAIAVLCASAACVQSLPGFPRRTLQPSESLVDPIGYNGLPSFKRAEPIAESAGTLTASESSESLSSDGEFNVNKNFPGSGRFNHWKAGHSRRPYSFKLPKSKKFGYYAGAAETAQRDFASENAEMAARIDELKNKQRAPYPAGYDPRFYGF